MYIRNRYKETKSAQWHIFCQRVGLMMGRLLVWAPDCWPTMSGISSDGKEVKDIFRCLAEITLNMMINILLMLEYVGVLQIWSSCISCPHLMVEGHWPTFYSHFEMNMRLGAQTCHWPKQAATTYSGAGSFTINVLHLSCQKYYYKLSLDNTYTKRVFSVVAYCFYGQNTYWKNRDVGYLSKVTGTSFRNILSKLI